MSRTANTSSVATSSSGSSKYHSAQAENVHVQSVVQTETQSKVSMENSKKMNELMSRLGESLDERRSSASLFRLKVRHICKSMNILADEPKKSAKPWLNRSRRSWPKLNNTNNNFWPMPIHALLVSQFTECVHRNDVSLLELENDFKMKIQEHVSKLDSEKATLLAQLERELNARQEIILESARKRIDDLNEEANRLKMVSSK
jgi:hypothetical protein